MGINSDTNTVSGVLAPFTVTRFEAEQPKCVVLFAVGRGGNPGRHHHLLQTLANGRCTVIAPHFEMLASTVPTKAELDMRIRRLEAAIESSAHGALSIVGIGHSIGAVALLALQGAKGETLDGQELVTGSTPRLKRLALLAPPTDFFRRPGALHGIKLPMKIWVGAKDTITPPAQSHFLMEVLAAQASVTVQVDPDAGHFTYMSELPPNVMEPHPDRNTFLAGLAHELAAFLLT